MNNYINLNKYLIFYTGFYSIKNHKNILKQIDEFLNLGVDSYFYLWYSDNDEIHELKQKCKNVFLYNFEEYVKNKSLISFNIINRKMSTEELCSLSPIKINELYGSDNRSDLLQLEFFEYWSNRMSDQYFLVNKAKNIIENTNYKCYIRSRADIAIKKIILNDNFGINAPFCNINGNKDHIIFGDKQSMLKYCDFYNNIKFIYPIKNRIYNLQNQSSETLLKFYIEEYETKINFNINLNLLEFENYYINK
jgi:hypothetical protein